MLCRELGEEDSGSQRTAGLVPGADRLSIALCTWIRDLFALYHHLSHRFTWLHKRKYYIHVGSVRLIREHKFGKGVAQF